MEVYQSRIDSYKPKRIKPPSAKRATTIKWPHPAKVDALAEAGFFWQPTAQDRDNVQCFLCGKTLAGWEEDDDPLELHWEKCKDKCGWAASRCGLAKDQDRSGK